MKRITPQILIHIIGCVVFLSLPILFSPDFDNIFDLYKIPPFQLDFIGYIILVIYFYANYYIFIPKYYFQKKYAFFAAITLLCFLLVSFIPNLLVPMPDAQCSNSTSNFLPPTLHETIFRFFYHHFFEFLIVCTLSLMLKISSRLKLAETEKVNAELSYLKAQINPHFLFNTLNSIYSLAIEKSDYTATAVVKLSGMMRYVITDASHKFVPLEKEITYISNYIDLQKLRIDSTIKLFYQVTG
ncbi:MAG TPA: histidine kinase, partial [Bacteroidia bacterium]|nr:histidine kinase [Bacteroidia bacterium]